MFGWLKEWFARGARGKPRSQDPALVPLAYCEAVKMVKGKVASGETAATDEVGSAIVFLNPLVTLLAAVERQKGRALTEREVLAIRNEALCLVLPADRARSFYERLDAQASVPRIDPERCWSQWQKLRRDIDRFAPQE